MGRGLKRADGGWLVADGQNARNGEVSPVESLRHEEEIVHSMLGDQGIRDSFHKSAIPRRYGEMVDRIVCDMSGRALRLLLDNPLKRTNSLR